MTCSSFCKRLAILVFLASSAIAAPPSFYARRDYGNGNGCAGTADLAIGDANGDRRPDVACGAEQFLIGDGRGDFFLSPAYPNLSGPGLFWIDLNNDGVLDILNLNISTTYGFKIAYGLPAGGFTTPVFYPVSDIFLSNSDVGDFNGDGYLDGVTIGNLGVWVLTSNGGDAFDQPVLAVPGVGDPFNRFPIRRHQR